VDTLADFAAELGGIDVAVMTGLLSYSEVNPGPLRP
jgi:hypothetical protein